MTEPASIAIIALAFLLGGGVKGLAGMGLPVVTVAILTFAFGLPNAMALMIVPGLLANAWQATGVYTWTALRRILPFLLPSLFTIWLGTGLLITIDNWVLVSILGVILTLYAILNISGYTLDIPRHREKWAGPIFGLINGITTGMTGVTSTPSILYMNGLGMKRDMLIQAMGLLFLISYVVLSISLWLRGLLNIEVGTLSFAAVFPALLGMRAGQKLRSYTSEASFKKILNIVLLIIGSYLMVRPAIF